MIALFLHNIMVLPVMLPLCTAAGLLFADERRHALKAALALACAALLALIAATLVYQAGDFAPNADVYNLGNWPAPFGIVFVLDRLSAVFLLLAALTGFCALLYATAYWDRQSAHFYSFCLFFLAGVNGVFLTGDIFNLFVFFEVMLAASYALLLHGSGLARVRAGMHYVTVNLVASFCFLLGAACIYGAAGTLNMADIASRLAHIPAGRLLICHAGMVCLGLAFLIKAGAWPLGFWVPATYGSASAPAAALFAITGKTGLYVLARLSLLFLEQDTSGLRAAAGDVFFYAGLITLSFGFMGILAAQSLPRLAANSIPVSAGIVLAALGLDSPALTAAAVYYIASSTLAIAAFFLLTEPIERSQDAAANVLAVTMEVYGDDEDEEPDEIGFYIPGTLALLGGCFALCAIVLIGLPPLSGFIAKFMLLCGLFWPQGFTALPAALPAFKAWLFMALLLVSGFAQLIALTRSGIRLFWAPLDASVPKMRPAEITPVLALLALCLALALAAEPAMRYLESMAAELHMPANYIHSVLGNAGETGE